MIEIMVKDTLGGYNICLKVKIDNKRPNDERKYLRG